MAHFVLSHQEQAPERRGIAPAPGRVKRPSGRIARLPVFLACWALFLQFLIPLIHVPPSDSSGVPGWALASICHGDGDSAAADRSHGPDKPNPGNDPPVCPICLGLHLAGTFMAPAPVPFPIPSASGIVAAVGRQNPTPPSPYRGPAQARAPPVSL